MRFTHGAVGMDGGVWNARVTLGIKRNRLNTASVYQVARSWTVEVKACVPSILQTAVSSEVLSEERDNVLGLNVSDHDRCDGITGKIS